jgi:hypothetical protein
MNYKALQATNSLILFISNLTCINFLSILDSFRSKSVKNLGVDFEGFESIPIEGRDGIRGRCPLLGEGIRASVKIILGSVRIEMISKSPKTTGPLK